MTHYSPFNIFTMQEQVSGKVQDNKVAAAHGSNNMGTIGESASDGKAKRTERKTQAQIIVEFLSRLGAYEADAIRIALALGKETATPQSLSPEDRLCINRYLNVGLQKENVPAERVGSHRTMRAVKLVERLLDYADKSQLTKANYALAIIAMDAQDVENARKVLLQGRQG